MDKKELEEGSILRIDFEKRGGFVPVIVQNALNNRILMLAYANKEAFDETLRSSMATFWSTSRNELWTKGATSGDFLKIVDIYIDCDQDAIVYRVEPRGQGACHTKNPASGTARKSCFYRSVNLKTNKLDAIE